MQNYLKHAVATAIKNAPADDSKNWICPVTDAVYVYLCPAANCYLFNIGYGKPADDTYIAAAASFTARPTHEGFTFEVLEPGHDAEDFVIAPADDATWKAIADGLAKALSADDYLILLGKAAAFNGPTAEPEPVVIDDLGGI